MIEERRNSLPCLSQEETKRFIKEVVNEVLTSIGIEYEEHMAMQKDFQCLRDFRESSEKIKSGGIMAAIAIFISGMAAILWLGFKQSVLGHD